MEQQHKTLLKNMLIANNPDIAQRVMDVAKHHTFSKGKKIIEQGAYDDDVYFIISGKVSIRIENKHIDYRSAHHTVGEMAAKKGREPRTADAIVVSDTLEALSISGSDFRTLIQDFSDFSQNLDDLLDALSREKILQLGENKKRETPWAMIAGFSGIVASLIGVLITWNMGFSAQDIIIYSLTLGIFIFILILSKNPILSYRRLACAAGYALILYMVYGIISYNITFNGTELNWPLIDFSVQTEQKIAQAIVISITLLLLTLSAGFLDIKLSKSQQE